MYSLSVGQKSTWFVRVMHFLWSMWKLISFVSVALYILTGIATIPKLITPFQKALGIVASVGHYSNTDNPIIAGRSNAVSPGDSSLSVWVRMTKPGQRR
jgi:hypothetical protein